MSENRNNRLWVYALIGVVLTAALYFPTTKPRMNYKIHRMNRTYWNAVKKGDFEKASAMLDLDEGETAVWIERAETLYDEGVRVVEVQSRTYSDDFCPKLRVDVTVEYHKELYTYPTYIHPEPQQCNGALFDSISVLYARISFDIPDDESEMMHKTRWTLSDSLHPQYETLD